MVMKNVVAYPITVNMDYATPCTTKVCPVPTFVNFTVRNVVSDGSAAPWNFECLGDSPCKGFAFENITITNYRGHGDCENVYGTAVNVSPSMAGCLNRTNPPPPHPSPPPAACRVKAVLGCFNDSAVGPYGLLPAPQQQLHDKVTLEACASACSAPHTANIDAYTVAGVDAGNHCSCGNQRDVGGNARRSALTSLFSSALVRAQQPTRA